MPKIITDAAGNVVVVKREVGQVIKGDQTGSVRIEMRGKGKGMTVTTLPDAAIERARGYFSAVAALLRLEGRVTPAVRTLFAAGGDPTKAESDDVTLFRAHGLLD
ncbi:hypothetical protein [Ralstonia pickettii]|uniref:Uncharacterized protein n=1 Tax=Ralstonia pickettii TaxID=329 RepID=A0AAW4Q8Z0_RALPI|nr:hypothetical protein [Ralstonia pickettii]MBA9846746.1 hypothetical protein [Ralstonia pickettii]MBA9852102.1 hypothetical protein [Ralstonia pickettii]MBA9919883.1 hypothetical protein [Ralstonia pickettii]MBA9958985.1 hypothetical protein [Ralstonia pickettii]MBA9964636.1 hypothetical protein [Ralstonia pickettii]